MQNKISRIPLAVVCSAVFLATLGISIVMSARPYKTHEVQLTEGKSTLIHLFNRDTRDELETRNHNVILEYEGLKPSKVTLEYFFKDSDSQLVDMDHARDTNIFAVSLPKKAKPGRYFYRFRARYMDGTEAVFQKSEKELFFVTFEGKVPGMLYIFHISLMVITAILLFFSLYFILELLMNKRFAREAYLCVFWGFVVFLVASFVLGPPTSGYAFGEPFGAWPFGTDITDTKSFYFLLFWLIPILLRLGDLRGKDKLNMISEKAFGFWCVVLFILGLVVFLIPHSLFIPPKTF